MPLSTNEIPIAANSLFLFVGPADGGKSYAATSFGLHKDPYGRPCYLMEMDGRLNALRGRPVVFDAFTNEEGAIGVLNRLNELRESMVKMGRAPFHTLIFDSFTGFNDLALADSHDVTIKKREGGQDKGRVRGELVQLTVEDYGYEAEAIRQAVWEHLTDIKKYAHVIVTAHEVERFKVVKGPVGSPTVTVQDGYKMLARDKIAARVPTKFDEIYHFPHKEVIHSTKSIRRQVIFQDDLARTSYPVLAASTAPHDISGKEFYLYWRELIEGKTEGIKK